MGSKYDIDIEVNSRPKAEYLTDEYFALDLPVAPAIMVEDDIITEGRDVSDHTVEAAICRALGLPEPEPEGGKSILGRLFGK